jgi:hypothetical protein
MNVAIFWDIAPRGSYVDGAISQKMATQHHLHIDMLQLQFNTESKVVRVCIENLSIRTASNPNGDYDRAL